MFFSFYIAPKDRISAALFRKFSPDYGHWCWLLALRVFPGGFETLWDYITTLENCGAVMWRFPDIMLSSGGSFQNLRLFLVFFFLGPHPRYMEVSRLEVKSELQLLAYTTATATPDPSHVFDLHHSSQRHWILTPLSKARDQTCVLMDTSWVCYC